MKHEFAGKKIKLERTIEGRMLVLGTGLSVKPGEILYAGSPKFQRALYRTNAATKGDELIGNYSENRAECDGRKIQWLLLDVDVNDADDLAKANYSLATSGYDLIESAGVDGLDSELPESVDAVTPAKAPAKRGSTRKK